MFSLSTLERLKINAEKSHWRILIMNKIQNPTGFSLTITFSENHPLTISWHKPWLTWNWRQFYYQDKSLSYFSHNTKQNKTKQILCYLVELLVNQKSLKFVQNILLFIITRLLKLGIFHSELATSIVQNL